MNKMTHVEVTSLLLLINTLYTASQGRCGHLTTKTPEKITCMVQQCHESTHTWTDMEKFSSYKWNFVRFKLGCKANQYKEISTAFQQKIETHQVCFSVVLYMLMCKHRQMHLMFYLFLLQKIHLFKKNVASTNKLIVLSFFSKKNNDNRVDNSMEFKKC